MALGPAGPGSFLRTRDGIFGARPQRKPTVSRCRCDDRLMWVRMAAWMVADREPPLPSAGSLLTDVGLRMRGEVTVASPDTPDGIVEVRGGLPHETDYRLVGRILEPRDFEMNTGTRFRPRRRHAGVEFLLIAGPDRFQVQSDGWAHDLTAESRVAVTGRLELVGEYEWDAFHLDESRSSWVVKTVVPADHDDFMLDVVAPVDG